MLATWAAPGRYSHLKFSVLPFIWNSFYLFEIIFIYCAVASSSSSWKRVFCFVYRLLRPKISEAPRLCRILWRQEALTTALFSTTVMMPLGEWWTIKIIFALVPDFGFGIHFIIVQLLSVNVIPWLTCKSSVMLLSFKWEHIFIALFSWAIKEMFFVDLQILCIPKTVC